MAGRLCAPGAHPSWLFGTPAVAAWLPMTGMAFLLFTFYMVTDPATSPSSLRGQIVFGAAVAFAYAMLMIAHVVFGLFFSLTLCARCAAWACTCEAAPAARQPIPVAEAELEPVRRRKIAVMTPAIAIVGMACRYPDARSPAELWENVLAGRRAFRRMPPERLCAEDYYSPRTATRPTAPMPCRRR